MENKKISISRKISAFLLSILTAFMLIFSLFTFPVELVLLNPQSYNLIIKDTRFSSQYPEIITNVLMSQYYDSRIAGNLPEMLSNKDAFRSVLISHLPIDWVNETMSDFTLQVIDYLNFRLPSNSMSVELSTLKSELILKSNEIAQGYINSLSNCSAQNAIDVGSGSTIFDLPPCKPGNTMESKFVALTSDYLEDLFNQLPSKFTMGKVSALDSNAVDRFFYSYSFARWILRLIPILSILLLIAIARLLGRSKPMMIGWVGRLLVITSAVSLGLLVIILIGFDQFIALMINRSLNNFIQGFDVLLLGLIQTVGYQTLVWVVISALITLVFGALLLIIGKYITPKPTASENAPVLDEELPAADILPDKTEKPQTIEEIEAEENGLPKEEI